LPHDTPALPSSHRATTKPRKECEMEMLLAMMAVAMVALLSGKAMDIGLKR
jgi:hypothetical protein